MVENFDNFQLSDRTKTRTKTMTVDYFESYLCEIVEKVFYEIYETEPGDIIENAYVDKVGITALVTNIKTDYSEWYVWPFNSNFYREIKKYIKIN